MLVHGDEGDATLHTSEDAGEYDAESSSTDENQDGDEETEESKKTKKDTAVPPGRPILVKFLSRRVKTRVMALESRKNLKTLKSKSGAIFLSDDLTKRRAKIAFVARNMKRQGIIKDTWVHDCKVLIKDNYNRIHAINSERDLSSFNEIRQ